MQPQNTPDMDDGFGYWLAGFIDGEGYFGIHRIHAHKSWPCWGLRFTLKLRIDDLVVLEECQRRLGVGNVRREQPKHGHPQAFWTLESKAACWALVSVLDRHPLRSKKARDYRLWRMALVEWDNGAKGNRRDGQRDWSRMAALHQELDAVRNTVVP